LLLANYPLETAWHLRKQSSDARHEERNLANINSALRLFGIDPGRTASSFGGLRPFFKDLREFKRQSKGRGKEFPLGKLYPCLHDRTDNAGHASGGYFHQDIIVARRIFECQPRRHVDVGSRIDGFVAHVAVFRPIEVIDIRPLTTSEPNITFRQLDITKELEPAWTGCTDSLSCLHTLEHFGLGRYGDPIDFDGHKKGLRNLIGMLEPGGRLHLSVPIGPQRVEFNAHRVFSPEHVVEIAGKDVTLSRFYYVNDRGDAVMEPKNDPQLFASAYGCNYGVGIFELVKT